MTIQTTIEVERHGVPVRLTIEADYTPPTRPTYDHPGDPEDCEIHAFDGDGEVDLTPTESNRAMEMIRGMV